MGPALIAGAFLVLLVWAVALVAAAVRRRSGAVRVVLSLTCMPPALFCVFGLAASREPGVSPAWTIGYALAGLLFAGIAAALSGPIFRRRG